MGFLPGNGENRTKWNNELTRAVSSLLCLLSAQIKLERQVTSVKQGQGIARLHQGFTAVDSSSPVDPVLQGWVQPLEAKGTEGGRGTGPSGHQGGQGLPAVRGDMCPGGIQLVFRGIAEAVIVSFMYQVVVGLVGFYLITDGPLSSGVDWLRSIS